MEHITVQNRNDIPFSFTGEDKGDNALATLKDVNQVVDALNALDTADQAGIQFQADSVDLGTQGTVDNIDFVGGNVARVGDSITVDLTPPYLVYTALLAQAGTGAPTATILQNTLGATIVWTRANTGLYTATASSSVFSANKVVIFITLFSSTSGQTGGARTGGTTLGISTATSAGVNADSILNASIEIRIYS